MPLFRKQFPPQDRLPARHLIVGLGNPGAQYDGTRHNIGFQVIQELARRHKVEMKQTERRAQVGYGEVAATPVVLAKPVTYMNLSGESVVPLMKLLSLTPDDLIIVVDDMDLPVGRLRVRRSGSAGGHNGLKSLIQHLGTDVFPRIRVGVGRPTGSVAVVDHVLSRFTRDEFEAVEHATIRAADAVETAVEHGIQSAMNRYNPSPGLSG